MTVTDFFLLAKIVPLFVIWESDPRWRLQGPDHKNAAKSNCSVHNGQTWFEKHQYHYSALKFHQCGTVNHLIFIFLVFFFFFK